MSKIRFVDPGIIVNATGGSGGSSISSSYALSASYADFATSASYAVSASYEIIKEVSSSYADTASFAQSGNGIFSGSFSGSYVGDGSGLTSIPASGIIGLPVVSGTTDTIPIFTSANGIGDSVITYDGESFIADLPGGFFSIKQSGGDYVRILPSQNLISTDGNFLILEGSKGVTLTDGSDTATYTGGALELVSGGGDQTIIRNTGDIEVTPDGGDTMRLQFPSNGLTYTYSLPTASGTIALTSDLSGYLPLSGGTLTGAIVVEDNTYIEFGSANATWQFEKNSATGYLEITNTDEEYVTALFDQEYFHSEGISVTERIIFAPSGYNTFPDGRLLAATLTDTRSWTLPDNSGTIALLNNSGSGDFQATGSFTGSFQGDGSRLTGIDPFPFSGSAVITGSLVVSGSSKPLEIIGSGSTVFSVVGSLGELFAIDDQLSGSLLVVNDISGLPQFEVFSDGRTLIGAEPRSLYTTATINATTAATSESIYSLSTSSYDGVFFDYTVTSASNARAGNIMSIWNGGNLVYTENTTTDIGSTVGVTFNVEISQSQAQLISVTDTAGWKIKTTIRSI